jgi:hypothetical protein
MVRDILGQRDTGCWIALVETLARRVEIEREMLAEHAG